MSSSFEQPFAYGHQIGDFLGLVEKRTRRNNHTLDHKQVFKLQMISLNPIYLIN